MAWHASFWLYLRAVWKHAWWLFIGVVSLVGDGADVAGVDTRVPRGAWYVIAALAFVAAQFLAFHDMRKERDLALSQPRNLDAYGAKRAYLEQQLREADRIIEDIKVPDEWTEGAYWMAHGPRLIDDQKAWENETRAELRRNFPGRLDIEFDLDDDPGTWNNQRECLRDYMVRSRGRLEEIRKGLP